MTDIAHNYIEMDKEQGGFTEGTGAVLRVFILWTAIVYRLIVLGEATYAVFMDLACFFDTVSAELVAWFGHTVGLPRQVAEYIKLMYEYSNITVRTAAGTATAVVRRCFKQG